MKNIASLLSSYLLCKSPKPSAPLSSLRCKPTETLAPSPPTSLRRKQPPPPRTSVAVFFRSTSPTPSFAPPITSIVFGVSASPPPSPITPFTVAPLSGLASSSLSTARSSFSSPITAPAASPPSSIASMPPIRCSASADPPPTSADSPTTPAAPLLPLITSTAAPPPPLATVVFATLSASVSLSSSLAIMTHRGFSAPMRSSRLPLSPPSPLLSITATTTFSPSFSTAASSFFLSSLAAVDSSLNMNKPKTCLKSK